MTTNRILLSDYLDLIYNGRNKLYGSYELRKSYPKRAAISLLILLGLTTLALLPVMLRRDVVYNAVNTAGLKDHNLADIIIDVPQKTVEPPAPPPPAAKRSATKFTSMVIEKDKKVTDDQLPPPQHDITGSGAENVKGDPGFMEEGAEPVKSGKGVVEPPPADPVRVIVEQMPVPGFDMDEYLGKNLHYPAAASENNIQGRVGIRFVVNEDGSVSNVQVTRGIGGGCDEEAVRVVSAMPKWKPGRQNGKPVKVYFQLPINFRLD